MHKCLRNQKLCNGNIWKDRRGTNTFKKTITEKRRVIGKAPLSAYLYLPEAKEGHQPGEGIQHLVPHPQQNSKGHPFQDPYSGYSKAFSVFYFHRWQMVMTNSVVQASVVAGVEVSAFGADGKVGEPV